MPLIPKRNNVRLSTKELLKKYQEWYIPKFKEEAPLTSEICLRNYGHIVYAKALLVVYNIFNKDIDRMIDYCEFIFDSWSSASGGGATIRYFPNWLVSSAMIAQYNDSIKSKLIKKKSELHATYSCHDNVGQSNDSTFIPEAIK